MLAWRGWGPSDVAIAVWCPLPLAWMCGQLGHRCAGFGMAPGRTLAPGSLSACERDTAACSCLLRARAALSAQEPLACTMPPLSHPVAQGLARLVLSELALHAGGLSWGLCAPACPAVACGQHCGQGNRAAGSCWPRWGCHCGRVLSWFPPRNLRVRVFPFVPCPFTACSGSSAGSGFPPLPHSHCIPKPGSSTPGSGIHYLQLSSMS